jgi:hypothetical protein
MTRQSSKGMALVHRTLFAVAIALPLSAGSLAAAPAAYKEPLDAQTLNTIKAEFAKLMQLANRHDFKALHAMFWQSPSALLVAKSAIASEGNWAGFWGNEAIDQKLHDIGTSGPVVLEPDYSKLKVVAWIFPRVSEPGGYKMKYENFGRTLWGNSRVSRPDSRSA